MRIETSGHYLSGNLIRTTKVVLLLTGIPVGVRHFTNHWLWVHIQAELKLHVKSYQEIKERERQAAEEVKQMRVAEERQQQIIATREIEKFRERVSFMLNNCFLLNDKIAGKDISIMYTKLMYMHVRRT